MFRNEQWTLVNIPNPRYLGSAITPGAVYISSSHDQNVDIVCFRGSMNFEYTGHDKENTALKLEHTLNTRHTSHRQRLLYGIFYDYKCKICMKQKQDYGILVFKRTEYEHVMIQLRVRIVVFHWVAGHSIAMLVVGQPEGFWSQNLHGKSTCTCSFASFCTRVANTTFCQDDKNWLLPLVNQWQKPANPVTVTCNVHLSFHYNLGTSGLDIHVLLRQALHSCLLCIIVLCLK